MWRATLGSRITLDLVVIGLGYLRVNARKSDDGTSIGKTPSIADFCHQLRPSNVSDAIHGHDGFILWQFEMKKGTAGHRALSRNYNCRRNY